MDEDVERAQISMDHPGADEPADTVEHLLQEIARVVEADILKSRGGTFLSPEVLHREAVLDPARGRRHADAALPGLTHHLVLVGGPPPHRVLFHGPPAPMGGPVEAVRPQWERRRVVTPPVDVSFLSCAYQAPDFRPKTCGQDPPDDGPLIRLFDGYVSRS